MISQYWFRYQAITWTNVDLDPCRHMASLGHNELTHWDQDKNGRHFPDDIFKSIFLKQNVQFLLKISLKFVPEVWINNIPA